MAEQEQPENKLVKIFSDLVGLFDTKSRASATVALILCILYLWHRNDVLNQERLQDQKDFSAQIIIEVRKQVAPIANKQIENGKKIEENTNKIDSTRTDLAPVIKSINETVKRINKKTK